MKRFFCTAFILMVFVSGLQMQAQNSYEWKETTRELPEQTINNPKNTEGIEIYKKQGGLIIKTPVRTSVKVLTILGQTISQSVIPAGVFELDLNTHGVFILRIGDNTLRVAI